MKALGEGLGHSLDSVGAEACLRDETRERTGWAFRVLHPSEGHVGALVTEPGASTLVTWQGER